ncbi:MAG TPA: flavodoxin family protein [Cellvibrio sp.]|nr:flavodoxin family protein [Cellvibrio sp.]
MVSIKVTKVIAIVFYSASGVTRQLAEAIGTGVDAVAGARASLYPISGDDIEKGRFVNESLLQAIDEVDAVIFGSPTYMGGPAAQFKAFADASGNRWSRQRWAGKVAAGFTSGECPSGDQLASLQYFNLFASQHGMIWCGLDIATGYDPRGRNPLGAFLGLASQKEKKGLNTIYLETAQYLGARVAKLATQVSSQQAF